MMAPVVALHRPAGDVGEVLAYPLDGHLRAQELVVARLVRDNGDVGDVALVAGAGGGATAARGAVEPQRRDLVADPARLAEGGGVGARVRDLPLPHVPVRPHSDRPHDHLPRPVSAPTDRRDYYQLPMHLCFESMSLTLHQLEVF